MEKQIALKLENGFQIWIQHVAFTWNQSKKNDNKNDLTSVKCIITYGSFLEQN